MGERSQQTNRCNRRTLAIGLVLCQRLASRRRRRRRRLGLAVDVRRRRRLTGRKLLPVAISGAAVAVASAEGWVSDEPLPVLLAAVIGASLLSELAAAALPPAE